jgi:hypothetical protein
MTHTELLILQNQIAIMKTLTTMPHQFARHWLEDQVKITENELRQHIYVPSFESQNVTHCDLLEK